MYEIMSDVPMPVNKTAPEVYPFDQLAPGQCFMVPCSKETDEGRKAERSIRAKSSRLNRIEPNVSNGVRFSVRRVDVNTIGCWRVS
ncbi:MAG: hypothetical protein EBV86_00975 [Marivivens sp.]|jgi:hypothetical protein|nr:hypothetical protein [Marivivens sp.]